MKMAATRDLRLSAGVCGGIGIVLACCATLRGETTTQESTGPNIAKGAKYSLSPQPNYEHCSDPGDATQLTDGQCTEDYFWTQKGTVGWSSAKVVTISVDLGKVQPISGVSFRTAAGTAGALWPATIRIQVSDDGAKYRDVGDLMVMDKTVARGLPEKYSIQRFITTDLRTRGRYVRFLVLPSGSYSFVDEVEVFRGPEALLQADPGGEPAPGVEAYFAQYRMQSAVRRRLAKDIASLEVAIGKSKTEEGARNQLLEQAAVARKLLMRVSLPTDPAFRAVLPLNQAHADMFKVQAGVWKAMGRAPLSAWAVWPWDPSDPFAFPPSSPSGPIEVHMMRGEYRAAAVNVANSTGADKEVVVSFQGLGDSPVPECVTVHEVEWTDTVASRPVAAALPEAKRGADGWRIRVLPGLARQIWLTFHVTKQEAGDHQGALCLSSDGGEKISIPLHLKVYPLSFPAQTTLWLGGWSYTNGGGSYGVTEANRKAFVQHLRERFVNAPWATSGVMMGFDFGKEDPPKIKLKTEQFDEWLTQWPNARAYLVFASVGSSIAGAEMGTPAFNQRVGAWITAWVEHLGTRGVGPERLGLLLVDEPYSNKQDDVIIAWAKAIRAAQPKVLIWNDPTYQDPTKGRPELFELSSILCPNRPMWLNCGKPFEKFYLDQQQKGRTLQFYSCSGPARLLDPYSYYRLQAWHCWQIGATGSFFWAFGDNSKSSSWNEYCAVHGPFTPLFLDDPTVTAGKQMEAIRESVEDYEYFVMLRKAVDGAAAAGKSGAAVEQARALLQTGANEVLGAPGADKLHWHDEKDRTKADSVRIKVLEALTALQSAE